MNVAIPQFQMKRTAQKNGPAEVAASPSHGSRAYAKETKNDMTDSTPTAGLTNRAPIFALENPSIELERFTSILSNLVEDLFDRSRREIGRLDGEVTLHTRHSELDDIEFIVGNVFTLARQIGTATTWALNDHIKQEGKGAVVGGKAINQLIARLKGNETPIQIVQVATDLARGMAA